MAFVVVVIVVNQCLMKIPDCNNSKTIETVKKKFKRTNPKKQKMSSHPKSPQVCIQGRMGWCLNLKIDWFSWFFLSTLMSSGWRGQQWHIQRSRRFATAPRHGRCARREEGVDIWTCKLTFKKIFPLSFHQDEDGEEKEDNDNNKSKEAEDEWAPQGGTGVYAGNKGLMLGLERWLFFMSFSPLSFQQDDEEEGEEEEEDSLWSTAGVYWGRGWFLYLKVELLFFNDFSLLLHCGCWRRRRKNSKQDEIWVVSQWAGPLLFPSYSRGFFLCAFLGQLRKGKAAGDLDKISSHFFQMPFLGIQMKGKEAGGQEI